jgi:LSD1 subclass zinc finger protein
VQESFTNVKFIRDDLHQLQAVIAYCSRCREERAPVVTPMAWGSVHVRCPICQATATLIVSEHDNSLAPWS